jgi:hypothetical protein
MESNFITPSANSMHQNMQSCRKDMAKKLAMLCCTQASNRIAVKFTGQVEAASDEISHSNLYYAVTKTVETIGNSVTRST